MISSVAWDKLADHGTKVVSGWSAVVLIRVSVVGWWYPQDTMTLGRWVAQGAVTTGCLVFWVAGSSQVTISGGKWTMHSEFFSKNTVDQMLRGLRLSTAPQDAIFIRY